MASKKIPLWLMSTLDAIAQHRATGEPLQQLVAKLARERRLGSHERKWIGDAAFGWARLHVGAENIRLPKRAMDLLVVLAAVSHDIKVDEWVQSLPARQRQLFFELAQHITPSWPTWFVEKIDKEYGEKAQKLLASLSERAKPVLAIDQHQVSAEDLHTTLLQYGVETTMSSLIKNAVVIETKKFSLTQLPVQPIWLMDEASQIVARGVAAKTNELVLDLCAGGGGKTRYLLQTGAHIVSADISEARLHASLKREKLSEATHVVADGRMPPFRDSSFDWVLVDAPCSGTGTLRRAPDLFSRLASADVNEFVKIQRELVTHAVPLLKSDGKLIYATCSVLPEENQQMAQWIAKQIPDLEPYPLQKLWGSSVMIPIAKNAHCIQLLPSVHGCDGFFVAAFRKRT